MDEPIETARGVWNEQRERAQFEQQLELSPKQIIRIGETDVGFITSISRRGEVELHALCVVPEYQDQGIGSNVIRQVAQAALVSGRMIALSVFKTNTRAKALYQRLGSLQLMSLSITFVFRFGAVALLTSTL